MNKKRFLTVMGGTVRYDWYVDSVNGSDLNDGKSPATALETISALTTISAGDKIGLARGSHWREMLTIAANDVVVEAYGNGNQPILDCSSVITSEWVKTADKTNVYETTVHIYGSASLGWVSVWEDNTRMIRATSVDNCDATANSYFPSDDDADADITLYIHASDSSSPIVNSKVYEFSQRNSGIDSYVASGVVINGVTTRRNLHNDGSIRVGRNTRVINCNCNEGSKHNIFGRAGSYFENVVCDSAYYAGASAVMFIINDDNGDGLGATLYNCTAKMDAYAANNPSGFAIHANSGGNSFGTITFNGCVATNLTYGFSNLSNISICNIISSTITNCIYGVNPNYLNVTLNITNTNYTSTITNSRVIQPQVNDLVININGGTWNTTSVSGGMIYTTNTGMVVSFQNVTVIGNGTSVRVIDLRGTGSSLTSNYNSMTGISTAFYNLTQADVVLVSDYNTFSPAATDVVVAGTTYNDVAAYQLATGQDAHSTVIP